MERVRSAQQEDKQVTHSDWGYVVAWVFRLVVSKQRPRSSNFLARPFHSSGTNTRIALLLPELNTVATSPHNAIILPHPVLSAVNLLSFPLHSNEQLLCVKNSRCYTTLQVAFSRPIGKSLAPSAKNGYSVQKWCYCVCVGFMRPRM